MTDFINDWPTQAPKNAWLTIGNFDGMHLGHQALIRTLNQRAKVSFGQSVVITFWPHPRLVLGRADEAFLLTTQTEKQRQLQAAEADMVLTLPFNQDLAQMSADDFLGRMVSAFKPIGLLVGPQFRLGRHRQADFEYIRSLCESRGVTCESFPAFEYDGQRVSSNRIRACLAEGRVEEAASLLGRSFSLEGKVRHGKHMGSKLGFPTANITPEPQQKLPRFGVYAVRVRVEGRCLFGVTSVGVRPTFEFNAMPNVETLILDFDDKIYDKVIRIEFVSFLRPELRFERVEDLIAQIEDDKAQTRRIFQNGSSSPCVPSQSKPV